MAENNLENYEQIKTRIESLDGQRHRLLQTYLRHPTQDNLSKYLTFSKSIDESLDFETAMRIWQGYSAHQDALFAMGQIKREERRGRDLTNKLHSRQKKGEKSKRDLLPRSGGDGE